MAIETGTYELDTIHSSVSFVVRHAMVSKVRGTFENVKAHINYDAENQANSSVEATIKTESVDTRNADRDQHLRTADFFDTDNYGEATFRSTKIDVQSDTKAVVEGELTIKGNTKPITLDVDIFGVAEDPYGAIRVGFEATTTINRKDFGIDFNAPLKTGGVLLSEDINLLVEGSAVKQ